MGENEFAQVLLGISLLIAFAIVIDDMIGPR
jgi:hypothetical protein